MVFWLKIRGRTDGSRITNCAPYELLQFKGTRTARHAYNRTWFHRWQTPKLALGASQDPSFETARYDAHDDVPISAWEGPLYHKSDRYSMRASAPSVYETNIEHESRHTEICCEENENVIEREVKCFMKDAVANEISTMVGELLYDVPRNKVHVRRSGVQYVVYKVFGQFILNMLRKHVIGKNVRHTYW